jgi:hypothetical protein
MELHPMRVSRLALLLPTVSILLAAASGPAWSAAEVHRLSLVLNAIPTSIDGSGFNDQIDAINRQNLDPQGFQTVNEIGFGWEFGAELRYFVRPNVAVCAGVSQLRAKSKQEYAFSRNDDLSLTAEVLSVPVHVGGDYYFQAYNQGDFQARAYVGGGFNAMTSTRATYTQVFAFTTIPAPLPSLTLDQSADGPGWYAEAGAHMFFAVRYSVMLGVVYRSLVIKDIRPTLNNVDVYDIPSGPFKTPNEINLSGIGARMSVAIGF